MHSNPHKANRTQFLKEYKPQNAQNRIFKLIPIAVLQYCLKKFELLNVFRTYTGNRKILSCFNFIVIRKAKSLRHFVYTSLTKTQSY